MKVEDALVKTQQLTLVKPSAAETPHVLSRKSSKERDGYTTHFMLCWGI